MRTLADLLAKEAGLSDEERDKLRWGALLHDIGKLAVPGAILNKPDRPDEAEWATLKRHPEEGAHLVEPLETWLGPWAGRRRPPPRDAGTAPGYPQGLAGEDISLGGRILAIADAYEVMTATRAYKVPMSAAAARKELVASAGTHFDPSLVRAFMGISSERCGGPPEWPRSWPRSRSSAGSAPPRGSTRSGRGSAGAATAVATVDRPGRRRGARRQKRRRSGRLPQGGRPVGGPGRSSRRCRRHRCTGARGRADGGGVARPTALTAGASPPVTSLDTLLGGIALPATTTDPRLPTAAAVPSNPSALVRRPSRPHLRPPSTAPQPFTAQGQLVAPDLLGQLGLGLTNRGPGRRLRPVRLPGPRRLGLRTARPTRPAPGRR